MKHLILSQIEAGGTISQGKLYGIPNEIYNQVITLLNDNSIIEAGHELETESNIKSFKEIKIGDIAYHESCESIHEKEEGPIIWKGNSYLLKLEKPRFVDDLEDETGEDWENLEEYNQWVIVDIPMYGHTLYNYNIDPSGVKVFK